MMNFDFLKTEILFLSNLIINSSVQARHKIKEEMKPWRMMILYKN